jgi:hypothetical protein
MGSVAIWASILILMTERQWQSISIIEFDGVSCANQIGKKPSSDGIWIARKYTNGCFAVFESNSLVTDKRSLSFTEIGQIPAKQVRIQGDYLLADQESKVVSYGLPSLALLSSIDIPIEFRASTNNFFTSDLLLPPIEDPVSKGFRRRILLLDAHGSLSLSKSLNGRRVNAPEISDHAVIAGKSRDAEVAEDCIWLVTRKQIQEFSVPGNLYPHCYGIKDSYLYVVCFDISRKSTEFLSFDVRQGFEVDRGVLASDILDVTAWKNGFILIVSNDQGRFSICFLGMHRGSLAATVVAELPLISRPLRLNTSLSDSLLVIEQFPHASPIDRVLRVFFKQTGDICPQLSLVDIGKCSIEHAKACTLLNLRNVIPLDEKAFVVVDRSGDIEVFSGISHQGMLSNK